MIYRPQVLSVFLLTLLKENDEMILAWEISKYRNQCFIITKYSLLDFNFNVWQLIILLTTGPWKIVRQT